MELSQQFYRRNGRITLLGCRTVRVRSGLSSATAPSGHIIDINGFTRANTTLGPLKRRGDAGGLATRWEQIVDDIFDKEPFSLLHNDKYAFIYVHTGGFNRSCHCMDSLIHLESFPIRLRAGPSPEDSKRTG